MSTLLSFVIPCYRSENTIEKVIKEVISVVNSKVEYDYEIICVNDGSPDNVYSVLKELANTNQKIKVVNLTKNMGKHAAVLAGYGFVNGEFVINLDDDCQCPTPELWKLLEPVESGEYDIATAKYSQKKQAKWKNLGSSFNAKIGEMLLDRPKGIRFTNFCAIRRFVADEIKKYPNSFPFLEGLMLRVTQKIAMVPMKERSRGDDNRSGFTFGRSLALFSNGFTAFSVKPLRVSTIIGCIIAVIGFIMGIVLFVRKIIEPNVLTGYTSTIVIMLFLGGMNLMCLGMLGEYVGRIYICINKSPQYVIRDTINL